MNKKILRSREHANAMQEKFLADRESEHCTIFVNQRAEIWLLLTWKGIVSRKDRFDLLTLIALLFGRLHWIREYEVVTFQTKHGFSKLGAKKYLRNRALSSVLEALNPFLIGFGLFFTIVSIGYLIVVGEVAGSSDRPEVLLGIGVFLLVLSFLAWRFIAHSLYPGALRTIKCHPFEISEMEVIRANAEKK